MLILWSHALAALLFGALALSQMRMAGRRGFAVALAITALSTLTVAGIGPGNVSIAIVEAARDVAWLAAMMLFVRPRAGLGAGLGAVYAAVVAIAIVAAVLGVVETMPVPLPAAHALASAGVLFRMLAAAGGLVLVNHAHAACLAGGRGRARIVTLALAMMWAADLLAFGAQYAGVASIETLAQMRGLAALAMAALILLAGQRRDDRHVVMSRTVAVRSLSAAALAAYTGIIALLTSVAAAVGGDHARLVQTAIVIGATAALLTLLSTPWLRAWAKVKIAKHLFSHRYDYRVEWRRFTDTLGHPDAGPLATRVVKAIADLTDSPAGLLLVADGARLDGGVAWNWEGIGQQADSVALASHLARTQRIVELDAVRAGTAEADETAAIPAWLAARADAWAVVPLAHGGRLAGAVVLARPPVDRALDWEDLDLLRLAGTQAASHLAEDRAHAALAEAQRFDEFSRRFAFLIHDIKNVASQLALVARNAERHAANPDFRADMVATLKDSSERMAMLLARLAPQENARPATLAPVDVTRLVRDLAHARRAQHPVIVDGEPALAIAHPARIEQAIGHLIQNAIEASPAGVPVHLSVSQEGNRVAITIADEGAGMTAAFVRDELFRPFSSTKPTGFGIGAFEARQLIAAMDGTVSVTTREGEGTCFRILLAAVPAMENAA
ncbi:XrtA/PEP-CTERM system histidine kinase PrsK [Sphingomonas sp.]|jgi:putative PEP-CTERM system histidine kinase|uniref:XrtA/PEP-CTERM system histidine kinase PrsK n=1 Tax=Sphingomonas sp. TaxID=28214 RepID=UPI002ED8245B